MQSFCTLWSAFIPLLSSPICSIQHENNSSFWKQGNVLHNLFRWFLFWRWMQLPYCILKKLLCPVYSLLGWITGKGCYIVHRTKHSWHEKWACMFTVCTLQVIFWQFMTLNSSFSGISELGALYGPHHNCSQSSWRTIILLLPLHGVENLCLHLRGA